MNKITRILALATLSTTLSACSTFFDKDNTPPPTPLASFKTEINIQPLWYASPGQGSKGDYIKLAPAISGQSIFTASKNGMLSASNKISGKTLWRVNTQAHLSGGVAASDGMVFVGSEEGEVLALRQADGVLLWKSLASSEILAPPAASNGVVLAKSIDGRLTAFSEKDGHILWHYQQPGPSLILRGASAPQIYRSAAIAGFEDGNLAKLNLQRGNLLWEEPIALPEGMFAIERMVDIDADPVITGNRIYAATYQGQIAALDLASGRKFWTHDISSYSGMTSDAERVYISDAQSHFWAFDAESGATDWRQDQLTARTITGPAIMLDRYIVVGDAEGYLHWMNKQDGRFVARTFVNSSGILATPVAEGNILYVYTKDGHLAAWKVG